MKYSNFVCDVNNHVLMVANEIENAKKKSETCVAYFLSETRSIYKTKILNIYLTKSEI